MIVSCVTEIGLDSVPLSLQRGPALGLKPYPYTVINPALPSEGPDLGNAD